MEPGTSDEELIRLAAEGDRRAFEALAIRHELALHRYATRCCGSRREAEDALQDGLLAAWRGARTFRGEASARTWLFQVLVHACRRRLRRRAGEPDRHDDLTAADPLPSGERAPDEQVADAQLSAALERALAELPDEAREVLLLRDVEGLPGDEAAAALGIGLAAMKSRLHRARLELKERVEARLRPRLHPEVSP
ncbi:MAG: RNA polymerase sigma factor [Deltaproteobacteria bacterium]|nr:RNA polymerase sigma factor [Deltaproteobacteria bacterium]